MNSCGSPNPPTWGDRESISPFPLRALLFRDPHLQGGKTSAHLTGPPGPLLTLPAHCQSSLRLRSFRQGNGLDSLSRPRDKVGCFLGSTLRNCPHYPVGTLIAGAEARTPPVVTSGTAAPVCHVAWRPVVAGNQAKTTFNGSGLLPMVPSGKLHSQ